MGENKRYYWLKLKTDFFNSKEMKKLRKLAGGDTFTIIYLKMQLLSLTDEGKLYFDGVEDSFAEEIALQIDEDPENVKVTILYLQKVGLIEMQADNELFLPEVPYMTGSETDKAEFMRQKRQKKIKNITNEGNNVTPKGNIVTQVLPDVTKCYTEIEIDIDNRERDRERDRYSADAEESGAFSPSQIVDIFHSICKSYPKVRSISEKRKKAIQARLRVHGIDTIKEVFEKAEASDFLKGKNNKNWSADFDWIMTDGNFSKILDGKYDNRGDKIGTNSSNPKEENSTVWGGIDFSDIYI